MRLSDSDLLRFVRKLDYHPGPMPTACWKWRGSKLSGYASFSLGGRLRPAHRIAFVMKCGEIPAGLQLDHLCRVPACVNPDHLEPVTARENILRGEGMAARWARRDTCNAGHPLTTKNLLRLDPKQGRRCLACHNARLLNVRQDRNAAGLCARCGKEPSGGRINGPACMESERVNRRRRYRAATKGGRG